MDRQEALEAYLAGMKAMIERAHPQRAAELAYSCYEGLVLDEGRSWEAGPDPDWLVRGKPKDCYINSLRLMVLSRDRGLDLRYCEGYYLAGFPDGTTGIPTLHAWCVDPDDRVIDPTWPHPRLTAYHGLVLPWSDVVRFVTRYQCGVLASEYLIGSPFLTTGELFPEGWAQHRRARMRRQPARRPRSAGA